MLNLVVLNVLVKTEWRFYRSFGFVAGDFWAVTRRTIEPMKSGSVPQILQPRNGGTFTEGAQVTGPYSGQVLLST